MSYQTFRQSCIWEKIDNLNLEPIFVRLVHTEDTKGLSIELAKLSIIEYRKFLYLNYKYKDQSIVPTKLIDKVWHQHILDTRKYEADCLSIFGFFLHHFPYFGMRDKKDSENLNKSFSHTISLWKNEFFTTPYAESNSSFCAPSCKSNDGNYNIYSVRPNMKTVYIRNKNI